MVKGSFSKVLAEPRLLKLNFGIMCLHILLMSTFVAPARGNWLMRDFRRLNTGRSTRQRC